MSSFRTYVVLCLICGLCLRTNCEFLVLFPLSPQFGDIFSYHFPLSPCCILSCLLLFLSWIWFFLFLSLYWDRLLLILPNINHNSNKYGLPSPHQKSLRDHVQGWLVDLENFQYSDPFPDIFFSPITYPPMEIPIITFNCVTYPRPAVVCGITCNL